jgi:transcriptional regulator with XRE-family HTH domain
MTARTLEGHGDSDLDPYAARRAFGRRMRDLRTEHGVSQDTLALRTGIHATAIGRLERGSREPRLTTILRIARGLDLPPEALMAGLTATVGEA